MILVRSQDITDEEIINMGKGICPNVKCIRVRRFNRRKITETGNIYVKTNTCVLTFEGTTLPRHQVAGRIIHSTGGSMQ